MNGDTSPVLEPARWTSPNGERLYGPADMASALDVTPSAVSNYVSRGTGPVPAPAYHRPGRTGDVPLWTRDQLEDARRSAVLELEGNIGRLEGRIARLERTAGTYRRRLARIALDTFGR